MIISYIANKILTYLYIIIYGRLINIETTSPFARIAFDYPKFPAWKYVSKPKSILTSIRGLSKGKEIRSFTLGPLFSKYLHETGATPLILALVQDLIYTKLKEEFHSSVLFVRPAVIETFEGGQVVLCFPSLRELSYGIYKTSGLSYLLGLISLVPKNNFSQFQKDLEDTLFKIITDGVPNACNYE